MKFIYQLVTTLVAISFLGACSSEPQAQSPDISEGNASKSSLTYYSMTPSDSEPTVEQLDVTAVSCELDQDARQVRIDLGEEGHVLVRDEQRLSDPAWLIVVDLTRLGIAGGKRENIVPAHGEHQFQMDSAGNIEGTYSFRLYGDLEGQYGVKLDIRCQG